MNFQSANIKFRNDTRRKYKGIIIFAILGIIISFFQLGLGILFQDSYYLMVGVLYIILCVALISFQNLARIIFISYSFIFLSLEYLPVLVASFTIDPFYKKFILFYLPAALLALYSIIYLSRSNIKAQFKSYSRDRCEHITFWRTYFCFLVFILLPSLYPAPHKLLQQIDLIIAILALVGLFNFAWQKKIAPFLFWKIFSLFYPIWNIYYEFFLQSIRPDEMGVWGGFSLFMVHVLAYAKILPLMIALYVYAFKGDAYRKKKKS